jgi:vacuolar-type H+-ATPase subunit D/Vma8
MEQKLKERIEKLKNELELGQEVRQALKIKQKKLAKTLLRIEGAIQVLEEELNKMEKDSFSEVLVFDDSKNINI